LRLGLRVYRIPAGGIRRKTGCAARAKEDQSGQVQPNFGPNAKHREHASRWSLQHRHLSPMQVVKSAPVESEMCRDHAASCAAGAYHF
jgi:hypothetical protein